MEGHLFDTTMHQHTC